MNPTERSIEVSTGPGRRPTVLQVVPALATGGVERGTLDVAAALVRAGWRAIVASSGGPMVHELERSGAEHVLLPLASKNPLVIRRNARRLARVIRERMVDIVHARSRAAALSAYWATEATGRHFLTTFHAAYGGTSRLKHFYNSVMSRGERVIAISEFVGSHAAQAYGVAAERLRVVPRGIDLRRFDPAQMHPSRLIALAAEWRLEDGVPVIMLPGRITRWKGHLEVVEAVARLGRKDLQVVFVGSDTQRPDFCAALVRRIQQRDLGSVIHLVGECRDMPAALMLADVVISASTAPEGFGRVAVEAQAMGRPIIATDHGGARETVRDGETGWLVPPGDPEAIAGALEAALSLGEAERLALANRSRAWIASRFDAQLMCERTIGIYEELIFPELGRDAEE